MTLQGPKPVSTECEPRLPGPGKQPGGGTQDWEPRFSQVNLFTASLTPKTQMVSILGRDMCLTKFLNDSYKSNTDQPSPSVLPI